MLRQVLVPLCLGFAFVHGQQAGERPQKQDCLPQVVPTVGNPWQAASLLATRHNRSKSENMLVEEFLPDLGTHGAEHASISTQRAQATVAASQALAAVRRLESGTMLTEASNATYHANASEAHSSTLNDKMSDESRKACRACAEAEIALIASLQRSGNLHKEAELKALALAEASQKHEDASADYTKFNAEFEQFKTNMKHKLEIAYAAPQHEYDDIVTMAAELHPAAERAAQAAIAKTTSETRRQSTHATYSKTGAAAKLADDDVAAKEVVEELACKSLGLPRLPTWTLCARIENARGPDVDPANGVDGNTYLSDAWGASDFTDPAATGNRCPEMLDPVAVKFKVFSGAGNLAFETGAFDINENVFAPKNDHNVKLTNAQGAALVFEQKRSGFGPKCNHGNACQQRGCSGQRTTFCVADGTSYQAILGGINGDRYGNGRGPCMCGLNQICGVCTSTSVIEIYMKGQ